jgi:hypothetical protein
LLTQHLNQQQVPLRLRLNLRLILSLLLLLYWVAPSPTLLVDHQLNQRQDHLHGHPAAE